MLTIKKTGTSIQTVSIPNKIGACSSQGSSGRTGTSCWDSVTQLSSPSSPWAPSPDLAASLKQSWGTKKKSRGLRAKVSQIIGADAEMLVRLNDSEDAECHGKVLSAHHHHHHLPYSWCAAWLLASRHLQLQRPFWIRTTPRDVLPCCMSSQGTHSHQAWFNWIH